MGKAVLDWYPSPTQTASKASAVRKRGRWVISASGCVEIAPWHIAEQAETVEALGTIRSEIASDMDQFSRE